MGCADEPLAYSIEELGKKGPISSYTWRRYMKLGLVRGIYFGRRRLIPAEEVRRVLTEGVRRLDRKGRTK